MKIISIAAAAAMAVAAIGAAPTVASARTVVAVGPGGVYISNGRHYRNRAWACQMRYGRRNCAWRYSNEIIVAGPGYGPGPVVGYGAPGRYMWNGRHWNNREWKCRFKHGRRACDYRYW